MSNLFHGNLYFHFAKTRLLAIVIEVNNKMEDEAVASDNIVTEFATYEDFLDSQITPLDLYYLEVIFRICLVLWLSRVTDKTMLSWEKIKVTTTKVQYLAILQRLPTAYTRKFTLREDCA